MSVKEGGRDWDTEEDGGGGLGEKWEEGHALQASERARVIVRYIVITRESEGEDERTSRMPLLVCVCVCVCVWIKRTKGIADVWNGEEEATIYQYISTRCSFALRAYRCRRSRNEEETCHLFRPLLRAGELSNR